jgi:hypothetical protein
MNFSSSSKFGFHHARLENTLGDNHAVVAARISAGPPSTGTMHTGLTPATSSCRCRYGSVSLLYWSPFSGRSIFKRAPFNGTDISAFAQVRSSRRTNCLTPRAHCLNAQHIHEFGLVGQAEG